jgi:hypothetical protein
VQKVPLDCEEVQVPLDLQVQLVLVQLAQAVLVQLVQLGYTEVQVLREQLDNLG